MVVLVVVGFRNMSMGRYPIDVDGDKMSAFGERQYRVAELSGWHRAMMYRWIRGCVVGWS
jgi:hypothetical protein